ncbi:hypothetical protein M413DRAFT_21748 [Hebeloma cylindrosporum]|uniref:F-box domain-containing protein n=1 Tax=Hebeloma cylindrosporum TaxID=76867 RepID=A0A0C2Z8V1_HEBCY|nr:hypothetical protein M413DRAFT_21748 [Hebeloma cylindrosporum h7]
MLQIRKRPVLVDAPVNVPPSGAGAKAGKKKRKVRDEVRREEERLSRSKRARRCAGLLGALSELPIELSQEVFSHLEPLDLLHLSRTSKQLRDFFLDRSSRVPIWQRSFANFVPAMPECPPDLTEPEYAELAFGDSCYFCGENTTAERKVGTIWGVRIRACEKCRGVHFHEVSSQLRPYGHKLFDILPISGSLFRWSPEDHYAWVYRPLDLALYAEFKMLESPAAKEEWVANKIKEWEPIYEHALCCKAWHCALEQRYEAERLKAIEERKAIVVERVKALGWEEELSLLSNERQRLENLPIVVEACNEDLTERVLSRLERHAVRHLTKIRTSRLKAERQIVLRPRLAVLKAFLNACVKSLAVNAIHPTASELFRFESVRNIINDVPATVPFTQQHLAPIREDFGKIIRVWREDIEDQLLELLSPGLSHIRGLPARWAIFNLATAMFSCSYPGCSRFLRYPEVMVHACATKPYHDEGLDIDIQIVNDSLNQAFWNFNRCITVNPVHVALVCDLLTKVGRNPSTANAQDWDLAIYECTSCYRSATGQAMVTLGRALVHCFDPDGAHGDGRPYNIVPVDRRLTSLLKCRMAEVAEQTRYNACSPEYNFVCLYCKEEGNFTDIREHIAYV